MATRGRFFRPKAKEIKGTKYDSVLEKRLHEGAFKALHFHKDKLKYHIDHTYEPDFSFQIDGKIYYIEVKGYFQDSSETQKYTWVKKSLKENEELVFVFEKPDKGLHFRAKRKDGTRMTHREWALKNNFKVYSEKDVDLLIKELYNGNK